MSEKLPNYPKKFALKAIPIKTEYKLPDCVISNSEDTWNFMKQVWDDADDINVIECMYLILMKKDKVIGYAKISQGGYNKCITDSKLIAKYIIDSGATCVILIHNHPSGDPTPSRDDDNLTKIVKKVCELLDVFLYDHLIITNELFYSYNDKMRLDSI